MGFRKGTWAKRLRFRKYLKSRLLASIHRKIPVATGGIAAYFGKRSGLSLGSRHRGPILATYF